MTARDFRKEASRQGLGGELVEDMLQALESYPLDSRPEPPGDAGLTWALSQKVQDWIRDGYEAGYKAGLQEDCEAEIEDRTKARIEAAHAFDDLLAIPVPSGLRERVEALTRYDECEKEENTICSDFEGEYLRRDEVLAILAAPAPAREGLREARPKVVCLCGSTRFMEQFFISGWDETLKGNIVLSVGVNLKMETPDGGHVGEAMGPHVKEMLDELHKRKIDLSDDVLVLNVGGYIGESTRGEITYAEAHGKPVRYLEEAALAPRSEKGVP